MDPRCVCVQESLKWDCWGCGVKAESGDANICAACSVARPTVNEGSLRCLPFPFCVSVDATWADRAHLVV